MKNVVLVFVVIFSVVLSSCNCKDEKKAEKDGVTTEAVAKKECGKKPCKGDKPCSADKSEEEKLACAADCTKPCCAEKKEEVKTACAADCKKECCAEKKTS